MTKHPTLLSPHRFRTGRFPLFQDYNAARKLLVKALGSVIGRAPHRPLEHGPGKGSPIPPVAKFDFVAKDFLDLANQLGV